jgi:hypothetical protein
MSDLQNPWNSRSTFPDEPGVYHRQFIYGYHPAKFDGLKWYKFAGSVEDAEAETEVAGNQHLPWRKII